MPGNHDSSVTQEYLASLPNVTVLDGGAVVEAAWVRWAGIGDPRYTPMILDGHVHERREQRVDGILELTQGSSGGAGLRTFDGEGTCPMEMAILHFDPDDHSLLAVDQITVSGVEEQL